MDIDQYRNILTGGAEDEQKLRLIHELGETCTPQSADLLLECLVFPELPFNREIIHSLFKSFSKEAMKGLLVMIKVAGPPLNQEIVTTLKGIDSLPGLTQKIKEWEDNPGSFHLITLAIELLEHIGDEKAVEVVVPFLHHIDDLVKDTATRCLGALQGPSCLDYLPEATKPVKKEQPVNQSEPAKLTIDIKKNTDMAFLMLGGVLDSESLPRLEKTVKYLITTGFLKIFLLCEQLKAIDFHSLKALDELEKKIKLLGSQLMAVGIHAATSYSEEARLENIECHLSIREAVTSLSGGRPNELVVLNPEMFQPGSRVELQARVGLKKNVSRIVTILSYDGQFLVLEWFPLTAGEVFKENLNPSIKLIQVEGNRVLRFDSVVVKQSYSPQPSIMLSRPRRGKVIGYRRYIRIEKDIPVEFYHVLNSQKIRKDLHGRCLDLSVKGMLLITKDLIPLNDVIIPIFTGHPLLEGEKVPGRIVQRRKCIKQETIMGDDIYHEYGVSFLPQTPDVQEKIARTVYLSLSALLKEP